MASKTDTSTAGRSDPSTVSAAALRLDPLLRKIRDGLSQYLEAFGLAIQGARRQDIKWPLFMVVVPDPGDGGTIEVVQQQAGDFVGFDNFAICKVNIPVSEADIETAASYLRHCGLDPDAQRLREVFGQLKDAFCGLGDYVPLSDGSTRNRKFYAQDRALMLSEHLEDLIRTLPAKTADPEGIVSTLTNPKPDPNRISYGLDCRCVNWYGTVYNFAPIPAACVKVLIDHYKHGIPDVGEQAILENVESSQKRLASVFHNGEHPAWGTMIIPGSTKGTFRIATKTPNS